MEWKSIQHDFPWWRRNFLDKEHLRSMWIWPMSLRTSSFLNRGVLALSLEHHPQGKSWKQIRQAWLWAADLITGIYVWFEHSSTLVLSEPYQGVSVLQSLLGHQCRQLLRSQCQFIHVGGVCGYATALGNALKSVSGEKKDFQQSGVVPSLLLPYQVLVLAYAKHLFR